MSSGALLEQKSDCCWYIPPIEARRFGEWVDQRASVLSAFSFLWFGIIKHLNDGEGEVQIESREMRANTRAWHTGFIFLVFVSLFACTAQQTTVYTARLGNTRLYCFPPFLKRARDLIGIVVSRDVSCMPPAWILPGCHDGQHDIANTT